MHIKIPGWILTIIVIVSLYGLFHIIIFGGLTTCEMRSKEKEDSLINTSVILKTKAVSTDHPYTQTCSPILHEIKNTIVKDGSSLIDSRNFTPGVDFTVTPINLGDEFIIVNVIAETKEGIMTFDSGTGPWIYYLLKDKSGNLLKISDYDFEKLF